MVDVHTFINRGGVDTYRVKLYMEEYPIPERAPVLIGLNKEDEYGYTPLMYVVKYTDPENIALLLNKGADINHKNKKGETPMSVAAHRQDRQARKVLVSFLMKQESLNEDAKKLGKETLEKYEQEKKEEEDLLNLEEKVRNFKPIYTNIVKNTIDSIRKYDMIQGKYDMIPGMLERQRRQAMSFPNRHKEQARELTEPEKEKVKKLEEQLQIYKKLSDKANAEHAMQKEQLEKAYKKRRESQTGSKRKTQKRKRVRRSKKTRGRK
jgi:hypothetical protein